MIRGKHNAFLRMHIVLKLFTKPPDGKHHMLKNKLNKTEHKQTVKTKASKLKTVISDKRTAFLTLHVVFPVVPTPSC